MSVLSMIRKLWPRREEETKVQVDISALNAQEQREFLLALFEFVAEYMEEHK